MERSREARRGSMAAMNGGLSRRRPRTSSLRDSPEEDGGMEMPESRLRERPMKKDRERERPSRSKRRRADRLMHGSNREEGDDSSEQSLDDDDDEEDVDLPLIVRRGDDGRPAAAASSLVTSPAPSSSLQSSNHLRKSFPLKVVRTQAAWKPDEMMGVPIPRKARSGTGKRSQDCWASAGGGGGGGGGVGGDPVHRQPSTSPARPSPSSTAPMSPSSSTASIKKKIKPITGSKPQRLPKVAKPSSSIQEIEIEVAEVLYGMTRQFHPKQDNHKQDSKETNGSSADAKSRVSSPISSSQTTAPAPPPIPIAPHSSSNHASMHVVAPKRKRPRPVKFDEESPASPSTSSALPTTTALVKTDSEPPVKAEALSPKSEKSEKMVTPSVENGDGSLDLGASQIQSAAVSAGVTSEPQKLEIPAGESQGRDRPEPMDVAVPPPKEYPAADLVDSGLDHAKAKKADQAAENQREQKSRIDLMAPPPGKLSPERVGFPDSAADLKSPDSDVNTKIDISVREERNQEVGGIPREAKEEYTAREFYLKKQLGKDRILDLQLDLEKHAKEEASIGKQQTQKRQSKPPPKVETKPDKAGSSGSMPVPMPVGGWPGNVPPFGYMGQVPSLPPLVPIDGTSASSKPMQPPSFLSPQPRPKRCATHCYIAQNIYYHQQIAKMNPFWPAAAGTMPFYGAKPYNLNVVPPSVSSSVPVSTLQGSLAGRSSGSLQDKGALSSKEKCSAAANPQTEAAQTKQLVLQQVPQAGPANNMLHGPAFIFSLNQQAAGGAGKSVPAAGNVASSSTGANTGAASSGAAVNFNYAVPANEAQYLAILQNNAYPFPIPAAFGAPPAYRGGSPGAQAMPFFNGSFYPSQMLHPSQLQQQQPAQQPPSHAQLGHQNPSTSSGSSSSQKHPQQSQQRVAGGAAGPANAPTAGVSSQGYLASKQRQHLLPHQTRQLESETGCEDSPSTADIRVSQSAQKALYSQNFAMPIHPQNFALMSPAAAALGGGSGGVGHGEKQAPSQLTPSQAFAMSFASLSGGAAAAGAPPGLDFSSMSQNHPIFQNLPEAARQGYQMTAVAAAAASQAAQHLKKSQQILDDGKSGRDSTRATVAGDEERKMMAPSKAAPSASQQSLNFARPDNNSSMPSILGNNVIDSSSRTLNLISPNVNGSVLPNRASVSGMTTSGTVTTSVSSHSSQQHQQQLIQLQKQQQQQQQQQLQLQQQQLQLQQQLASRTKSSASSNSASFYSDRLPASSTVTKFPQTLAAFPQALVQGTNHSQSQWKNSTRAPAPATSSSSPAAASVKTNLPQQQNRSSQQSIPAQVHQTQISFGLNSLKMAAPGGQQLTGGNSMSSLSSASASIVVGSPQNSAASKGSAGGSPRGSANAKPSTLPATSLPPAQQNSAKNSSSSSSRKSSPVSNRNVTSILGQPQITPAQSLSNAKQQQPQQKQPYPQAQYFFSNTYMPAHSSQTSASAAAAAAAAASAYYQRRQSEAQQPQQQQHNSAPSSSGMLSLMPSTLSLASATVSSDSAKAAASGNIVKGLPPAAGLLQHPAAAGFPYIHAMPSVSVKPAEQKPAAGT